LAAYRRPTPLHHRKPLERLEILNRSPAESVQSFLCSTEQQLLFTLARYACVLRPSLLRVPATADYKYACFGSGARGSWRLPIHCSLHSKSTSNPSSSKPQPPSREWNQRQLISNHRLHRRNTDAKRHCPFEAAHCAFDKSDRRRPDLFSHTAHLQPPSHRNDARANHTQTIPNPILSLGCFPCRNTNHPVVEFCLSGPGAV
jgi:hypothetical protein